MSHAWLTGQSLALLQPHAPDARQALPAALPTQVVQLPPTGPHTVCDVPGWHVLDDDAQQPDKHAIVAEQVFTQMPIAEHEVEPPGQSPGNVAQPHWPPPVTATHLWPF